MWLAVRIDVLPLIHCLSLALVVYDYIITFDKEVASVWCRKFTAVSALFYVNRYLAVLSAALVVAMNSITMQEVSTGTSQRAASIC